MFLYPIEKQVEICRSNNVGCLLSLNVYNIDMIDIEKLRDSISTMPRALHAPPHDMYLGSIDPRVRSVVQFRINQTLRIANALHASHIVLHMNYVEEFHKYHLAEWIENARELLSKIETNVEIHIENSVERSNEIFVKFFREVGLENVKFCLDIGHVIAYSRDSIDKWINSLANWIAEIHLHETEKGSDQHKPLGTGYIDWDYIFVLLEENGVDIKKTILTLEPRTEEDLKKSLEFLKNIL